MDCLGAGCRSKALLGPIAVKARAYPAGSSIAPVEGRRDFLTDIASSPPPAAGVRGRAVRSGRRVRA